MTAFVNLANLKTEVICDRCQVSRMVKNIRNIKELDEIIADYEELAKKIEDLIEQHPQMPDVPKGLEPYAQTPLTTYRGVQLGLAELKYRRMELLTKDGSEARLKYDIERALENEDYEKAARLRDQLEKKSAKRPRKKKGETPAKEEK